jgi:hypothetical protein
VTLEDSFPRAVSGCLRNVFRPPRAEHLIGLSYFADACRVEDRLQPVAPIDLVDAPSFGVRAVG